MSLDPSKGDDRHSPVCPVCRDAGAVIVPHPACVDAANVRLVGFAGGRSLRWAAFRCDRPFGVTTRGDPMTCPSGTSRYPNLPPLADYLDAVGGRGTLLPFDAMEREYRETQGDAP